MYRGANLDVPFIERGSGTNFGFISVFFGKLSPSALTFADKA